MYFFTSSDSREPPSTSVLPLEILGSHTYHYLTSSDSREPQRYTISLLVTVGSHQVPISYLC